MKYSITITIYRWVNGLSTQSRKLKVLLSNKKKTQQFPNLDEQNQNSLSKKKLQRTVSQNTFDKSFPIIFNITQHFYFYSYLYRNNQD